MHGPGNVPGLVILPASRVHDAHIRIAQMIGEPAGFRKQLGRAFPRSEIGMGIGCLGLNFALVLCLH
jgi:hypothetical protein